ncbi:deoxyribose-phosphate aldolase [Synechococcus sp. CC9616]|uniref:deoxyribose-phosphate aldolase n=1 Tax=Synechococcus sp. CC9616 TaxID=110663 RepID=UPI00048B43ED|nr:deoxyribose-phosphate aldolase [Synechococcus sp. CC9616]
MVESKLELPDLPPLMDQAILDPLLTQEELITACDAGRQENVRAICTTLRLLEPLRERLGKTGGPRLVAVVGFPFGSLPGELKQMEAEWAAARGAEELDMVPDFTALINQNSGAFAEEIAGICELGLPVRVVLDMARLSEDLITLAVDAAIDAGAAGLQTSNGFGPATSTTQVKQLLGLARGRCAVKAAGGIHTPELAIDLVEAGASLLGTSSAPQLLQALRRPAG